MLNSLLIFVIGFGTTHLAAEATAGPMPAGAPHAAPCSPRPGPVLPRVTAQRSGRCRHPPNSGSCRIGWPGAGRERAAATGTEALTQCAPESTPPPPPPAPEDRRPAPQEQFFKRW